MIVVISWGMMRSSYFLAYRVYSVSTIRRVCKTYHPIAMFSSGMIYDIFLTIDFNLLSLPRSLLDVELLSSAVGTCTESQSESGE